MQQLLVVGAPGEAYALSYVLFMSVACFCVTCLMFWWGPRVQGLHAFLALAHVVFL